MSSLCPHCGCETKEGYSYCPLCTRVIKDYQQCAMCKEPYSNAAIMCPYCQHKSLTHQEQRAASLELEVQATRMGALLASNSITGFFFPPIIKISQGRINVTKWSFLGLRTHHQEIQVTRVASVRYTKGVIWGPGHRLRR